MMTFTRVRVLTAFLAALCSLLPVTSHGNAAGSSELAGELRFRVRLDGREIGEHRYRIRVNGTEREVRSEARFDVKFLTFTAYRYVHDAAERWAGDCLVAMESSTDSNGERETVRAVADGSRLNVERGRVREQHDGCVMSFAYWNPNILKARQLLNSQTGELVPVTVTTVGPETLDLGGRAMPATRHRIVGPELRIDIWYAENRWVALEAPAKGRRRLRYDIL